MLKVDQSDFHEKLRLLRKNLGLSQVKLAEKLGISGVMVQRYETAPNKNYFARPGPATLKKINVFFQKTLAHEECKNIDLSSVSLEDLIAEIKNRGATDISFKS